MVNEPLCNFISRNVWMRDFFLRRDKKDKHVVINILQHNIKIKYESYASVGFPSNVQLYNCAISSHSQKLNLM